MHLDPLWIAPLATAGLGAVALALVAGALRKEVRRLHRAMRPLRVPARRIPARSRTHR